MNNWKSTIIFTDFVYVRLISLIWKFNGLIKPDNLEIDAGQALNDIYIGESPDRPLVIDANGVINVTDRAWDLFFMSGFEIKREIVFINCSALDEKIQARYKEYCKGLNIQYEPEQEAIVIFNSSIKVKNLKNLMQDVNAKILEKIQFAISECFEENEEGNLLYLNSTPIKASGEYNASKLIGNAEIFSLITIRLADLVQELITKFKIGDTLFPPCLLAVNLRACPFVAAISMLLKIDFETIDHFGPISKLLDEDKMNKSLKFYDYIYCGDFAVGGTEIKISQTYAHLRQSKLNHAIVLGSLHEPNIFKGFNLSSLVILKDLNPKAKFSLF